ncbi:MAG: reverse transcriptase domain-containing protein [Flavobacteriales bacterium]
MRGARLLSCVPHTALVTSGSFFSTSSNDKGDSQTSKSSVIWVLDSGASGMFTNDATILSNKQPTDSRVSGSNVKSKPMRVTHVGRYGIFPIVLLVPSISSNLMSVSILRKLGFHVDFMALRVSRGPIVWDFKHDKERDLFFLTLPRDEQKAFSALSAVSFKSWNLAEIYHRRFNHVSRRALANIVKSHGLKVPRKHFKRMRLCSGCALCKAINHPVPNKAPRRPPGSLKQTEKPAQRRKDLNKPFAHISIDTCGPITPKSFHGSNYYHVFVCKHTGHVHVACTALKSDVAQEFIQFHRLQVTNRGFTTKVVRTDGALELTRSKLQQFFFLKGIQTEVTPPFSSFANAHAERSIRTVTEGVRTLLTDAGVATKFWSYAVAAFQHVHNRIPRLRKRAPLHIITGNKPKIDHVRIFGSRCHVFVHPQERSKSHRFQPTARIGTFLGYVHGSKSFWVLIDGRVYSRRSVNFDEDIEAMTLKLKQKHHPPSQHHPSSVSTVPVEGAHPIQGHSETPMPTGRTGNAGARAPAMPDIEEITPHAGANDHFSPLAPLPPATPAAKSGKAPAPSAPKAAVRRSSRRNKGVTPLRMGVHDESHMATSKSDPVHTITRNDLDFISPTDNWETHKPFDVISKTHMAAMVQHALTAAKAADFKTPRTFKEAMNGPQSDEWAKAVKRELKSLREKGVWKVIERTKQKPIGMKWVFKVKQDENGHVTKFKARLVCQGFRQRHGVDFFETYAPVANYGSIRVLLAMAAFMDLEIHQMDVDVAFLNGILKETVHCKPPPGVTVPPGHVLQLLRALYGTKQAARVWWQNIDCTFLKKLGLKKSPADPCVYFRPVSKPGDKLLFLVLFVDDILIFSDCLDTIKKTKDTLKSTYSMTDQGELRWCLGMRVLRDRNNKIITLDQQRYILDVLERFGMSDCNPVATPAHHKDKLTSKDCPSTPSELKERDTYHNLFRSIVGSVSYAALSTRPDIATATIQCARFSHNPGKAHLAAAKRILRYLKGTTNMCIMFGGSTFMQQNEEVMLSAFDPRAEDNMRLDLMAFSDSDWAGDLDKRKSTSGFIFFINGGAVSWKSRTQKCVAQSSAEAEYIASSETAKEAVWLRSLISTVKGREIEEPTMLNVDNQAAISIIKNPVCSSRTKHIELRYHLVRDYYERKIITVQHVPTESNAADLLTKPLPRIVHCRLRDLIMSSEPVSTNTQ